MFDLKVRSNANPAFPASDGLAPISAIPLAFII
jgi:hypothetical protein